MTYTIKKFDKRWLAPNGEAVDGDIFRLGNNQSLTAKNAAGEVVNLLKVDTSGKLQLQSLPSLSSSRSISGDNDIVDKKFVDDSVAAEAFWRGHAIAAEAGERTKQDGILQSAIDVEKGRIDAILLASDADKDSFAEIVTLINSIDTTNDNAFASYVVSNNAALAQEVKDRQSGDNALSGRIDALELDPVSQAAVTAAINSEAATREKADNALSGRLDVLEADPVTKKYVDGIETALDGRLDVLEADPVTKKYVDGIDTALDSRLDVLEADPTTKAYVDGEISTEAAARTKADGILQSAIDVEKGRIDAILLASDADKDSFAEIVTLINSIDTTNDNAFASYVVSNNAALAQEVKDRQSGDNALSGRLDVLEADPVTKKYVDGIETALDGRLDVLEADPVTKKYVDGIDTALDSRLDVLEADPTTKAYVDGIQTALDGRLDVLEADPTTKTYVDGEISTEAAARTKADGVLQSAIDVEKGRIDAILLASDADKDSFAEIVTLINSIDTTNDNAFASYVISNNAALAQEVSDRQSGDSALSVRLDVLEADPVTKKYVDAADTALDGRLDVLEADPVTKGYVDTAIASEQQTRDDEIVAVEGRLEILEGDNTVAGSVAKAQADAQSYADNQVSSEAIQRQNFDEFLLAAIDMEKGRIDAILLASDADKDSFAEIVALINSVDTTNDKAFAAYVLSNDAALAQEVSDRQSGDSALSGRLDVLEADPTTKAYVDGIESALDGRLDVLEADPVTKKYVDGIDTAIDARLDVIEGSGVGSISAAASNAQSAAAGYTDSAISSYGTALWVSLEPVMESFTLTSQNIADGYIDLDGTVRTGHIEVFVGRLAAFKDIDYTIAGVPGSMAPQPTRITWIGQLASGGAAALVAGDTIHVRYLAG